MVYNILKLFYEYYLMDRTHVIQTSFLAPREFTVGYGKEARKYDIETCPNEILAGRFISILNNTGNSVFFISQPGRIIREGSRYVEALECLLSEDRHDDHDSRVHAIDNLIPLLPQTDDTSALIGTYASLQRSDIPSNKRAELNERRDNLIKALEPEIGLYLPQICKNFAIWDRKQRMGSLDASLKARSADVLRRLIESKGMPTDIEAMLAETELYQDPISTDSAILLEGFKRIRQDIDAGKTAGGFVSTIFTSFSYEKVDVLNYLYNSADTSIEAQEMKEHVESTMVGSIKKCKKPEALRNIYEIANRLTYRAEDGQHHKMRLPLDVLVESGSILMKDDKTEGINDFFDLLEVYLDQIDIQVLTDLLDIAIKPKEDSSVSFHLSIIHAVNKTLVGCDAEQATRVVQVAITYLSQINDPLDASWGGLSADQRQMEFEGNVALIASHGIKISELVTVFSKFLKVNNNERRSQYSDIFMKYVYPQVVSSSQGIALRYEVLNSGLEPKDLAIVRKDTNELIENATAVDLRPFKDLMVGRLLSANPPEGATVEDYAGFLNSDRETLRALVTNVPQIVPELVKTNTTWASLVAHQWLSGDANVRYITQEQLLVGLEQVGLQSQLSIALGEYKDEEANALQRKVVDIITKQIPLISRRLVQGNAYGITDIYNIIIVMATYAIKPPEQTSLLLTWLHQQQSFLLKINSGTSSDKHIYQMIMAWAKESLGFEVPKAKEEQKAKA